MKKQYLKPTTRVVVLQQCRILAGSPVATSLNGAPEGIGWAENGIGDTDVLR